MTPPSRLLHRRLLMLDGEPGRLANFERTTRGRGFESRRPDTISIENPPNLERLRGSPQSR